MAPGVHQARAKRRRPNSGEARRGVGFRQKTKERTDLSDYRRNLELWNGATQKSAACAPEGTGARTPRHPSAADAYEPAGEAIGDAIGDALSAGLAAVLASGDVAGLAASEAAGEDSGAGVSSDLVQAAVANIIESRARNRTFRIASSFAQGSKQVFRTTFFKLTLL
jgi:hypothetical protein